VTATPVSASLRRRVVRGSFFEVGGYGAQQLLRIASNLVLTRLLYPAAFGQVTIVTTISTGLVMLSDVAIQPCIIQSPRGDEIPFLNTAFTLQVLRGLGLALIMAALGHPAAWFYREPALATLIHVGALQLIINGFHSTSIFTMRRKLALGRLNAFDLVTNFVGTGVIVLLSWFHRTPMSLVLGALIGAALTAAASHFLPVPYRNRFHWEKAAAKEIGDFGRWVFGSSAAQFLGAQSDRILLGRFLGTAWLGVYGIAVNLSEMLSSVILRIIGGVLYPVLSEAGRRPNEDISRFFYRLRLRLDLLSMSAAGALAGTGSWLVHTLWDERYANAAWIVQLLCIRVAITLIVSPTETCLFALGQPRYLFARSLTRLVGTSIGIPVGWYVAGIKGVIWGTVLAEVPTLLAVWPRSRALGILRVRRELLAVAIFAAANVLSHLVAPFLPQIHLRGPSSHASEHSACQELEEERQVVHQVPAHQPGLLGHAPEPLEPHALHPLGRAADVAGHEAEADADAHHPGARQGGPQRVDHLLLLGRAEAHEQQVRRRPLQLGAQGRELALGGRARDARARVPDDGQGGPARAQPLHGRRVRGRLAA
jgi:O-antigen/teichoic acid export membrane protein